MLVPDLLGGSGSFGQPAFFASYNLAEVTGYVGILPLVAAFALLGRVRLRPRPPEWLIWHGLAVAGIVLALGGNTPVGDVLVHVPLLRGQRLQSRNILVADLALAVLLAYWADRPAGAGRPRFLRVRGHRGPDLETVLAAAPPLAVLLVAALGLSWGTGLLRWLRAGPAAATLDGALKPWLVPYVLLGAGALALVIAGPRLRPVLRSRWLGAFVVADLIVFTLLGVVAVATGAGRHHQPRHRRHRRGQSGRGQSGPGQPRERAGQPRECAGPPRPRGRGAGRASRRGPRVSGPFRDLRPGPARRARSVPARRTRSQRDQRHAVGPGVHLAGLRVLRVGHRIAPGHRGRAGRARPPGHAGRGPGPARHLGPPDRAGLPGHRVRGIRGGRRAGGYRPPCRRRAPAGHLVLRRAAGGDPAGGARRGRPAGRGPRHPDRAPDRRRIDTLVHRGRRGTQPPGHQPDPPADERRRGRPGGGPRGPARAGVGRRYPRAGVRGRRAAPGRAGPAPVGIRGPRRLVRHLRGPLRPGRAPPPDAPRPARLQRLGPPGGRRPAARRRRRSPPPAASGSSGRWPPRPGGAPPGVRAAARRPRWPCTGTVSSRPSTCRPGGAW